MPRMIAALNMSQNFKRYYNIYTINGNLQQYFAQGRINLGLIQLSEDLPVRQLLCVVSMCTYAYTTIKHVDKVKNAKTVSIKNTINCPTASYPASDQCACNQTFYQNYLHHYVHRSSALIVTLELLLRAGGVDIQHWRPHLDIFVNSELCGKLRVLRQC